MNEIKDAISKLSEKLENLTDNNEPVNISRKTSSRNLFQGKDLPAMSNSYKKTLHVNYIYLFIRFIFLFNLYLHLTILITVLLLNRTKWCMY